MTGLNIVGRGFDHHVPSSRLDGDLETGGREEWRKGRPIAIWDRPSLACHVTSRVGKGPIVSQTFFGSFASYFG